MTRKHKPDPAVMADLLRAAVIVNADNCDYFCCYIISIPAALGIFKNLYQPTPREILKGDRCGSAWMSCWNDMDHEEGKQRRVLALLLTREIYRNGDHVRAER